MHHKLVQFIDSSVMVVKNYSVNKKYKILLPVNNSLGSNKAIEIAQQFAKSKKMAVEIITVLENKSSDEELKSILKKTEKKFTNAGIKNTASILEGDPVQSVVKYAKDDCLVMLGVSPKNPILKYFFGSKPISIAQQCNCPVLIAK
jgi:nucleotide-binding universal stress UspA family protein